MSEITCINIPNQFPLSARRWPGTDRVASRKLGEWIEELGFRVMAGSDPLGELCLAAEKDAGEENRHANDARGLTASTRAKSRTGTDQNGPCSLSLVVALVAMYRTGCQAENAMPCEDHVELLTSIPGELVMDTRCCAIRPPGRSPGGAVLRVTSGSPKQVSALLETLAPPSHASAIVLVDTLDLTGVEVSHEGLAGMLDNALSWGPWWRLRCLVLRDCGLTPAHIRILGRLEAVPCLWNLEVLDLSENVHVGTDPATGSSRGPGEYALADVAFLVYLWKQAKLRRVSFKGCSLGTDVTECLLKVLLSYHLGREQGLECGLPMHGGTRFSLECLELGTCDDSILETLSSILAALPKLKYVDVSGLGPAARCRLDALMRQRVQGDGAYDPASTEKEYRDHHIPQDSRDEDGANREADLALASVEGTATAPSTAEATSTSLCANGFDPTTLLPPTRHVLPKKREHTVGLPAPCVAPDIGGSAYPRLPQQLLDDFGLNETIQNPPDVGGTGDAGVGDQVILKATSTLDKYSLNIVSPRRIARGPERVNGRQHRREYARVDRADENTVLPTRVIDLHSDDDDEGDEEASTSGSDEDADGRHREQPTIDQINFKMRDGALDEDSKLGRIYRATAKRNIASIADNKKKLAAKRAFSLWDQCTENSWDRRRWTNPSKTQNDEPHILGQLNLMFDILHAEGLDIGFPFPLWRPGKGANAFLPDEETVAVTTEQQKVRRSTGARAVEPDRDRPRGPALSAPRKRAMVASDSE